MKGSCKIKLNHDEYATKKLKIGKRTLEWSTPSHVLSALYQLFKDSGYVVTGLSQTFKDEYKVDFFTGAFRIDLFMKEFENPYFEIIEVFKK